MQQLSARGQSTLKGLPVGSKHTHSTPPYSAYPPTQRCSEIEHVCCTSSQVQAALQSRGCTKPHRANAVMQYPRTG